MAWVTRTPDDDAIIEEIINQSDRGAALIATAYLEERLLDAIKARTHRHDVEGWFYKGAGPCASFTAKIALGFLLGIYDEEIRRMFITVKDIRNEFAHKPEPRDFNSQKIRDLCKNINLNVAMELKINEQTYEFTLTPDQTPKTAFLNAIKWLLFITDMETKQRPLRRPAPTILELLGVGGQSLPEKS